MITRLLGVRSLLREKKIDACLVSSPDMIRYLTAFLGFSDHERDAYVLITRNQAYIVTNSLYTTAVKEGIKHMDSRIYSSSTPLSKHLTDIAKQHNLKRIGFEPENLTVAEWTGINRALKGLTPLSLRSLRTIKATDEVEHISQACKIADEAYTSAVKQCKTGMTEKALAFLIEQEMRKRGAEVAFPTIVAFGKHAASPHHVSDITVLQENDTILLDFGALVNGYNSDMTRTIFWGKPTKAHAEMYKAVLLAQKQAEDGIRTALDSNQVLNARDVDAASREYLIKLGYPSIPHSLGHGIGLAVHESPALSVLSEDTLSEGMVFSLEPGVYIPDEIGIRIEDLYTIQNNLLRCLTNAPK